MASKKPKKIVVTLIGFETHKDGIESGSSVSFKVIQSGKVLLEDTINGRCSAPYHKAYEVVTEEGDLLIEHNRSDLVWMSIFANFE
ncbi:hypothetical protein [Rahnella sp. WP5]|uniref:hypothetical protein n=1 Tax=Rahnella sp. WP5 TaxID=1500266 RepID=UPI000564005E|nr:hypothetical protein [Rahnella sp. WP5]